MDKKGETKKKLHFTRNFLLNNEILKRFLFIQLYVFVAISCNQNEKTTLRYNFYKLLVRYSL